MAEERVQRRLTAILARPGRRGGKVMDLVGNVALADDTIQ